MFRCFVISPRGEYSSPSPVTGRHIDLHRITSQSEGPFYPQVLEETTESSYTFFAGRLASIQPSAETLFASPKCDDWTFRHGSDDGSWLGLRFDRQTDTLSIASDRGLLQRWYYLNKDGKWYFCNSLIFLKRVVGRDLVVETRAAPYLVLFGYLPGKLTPLRDVYSLRPGEVLILQGLQARIGRRTSFPLSGLAIAENVSSAQVNAAALAEDSLTAIRTAVKRECEGLNEVVLPLSGGMDSRFVLACTLDVFPREQITTFTWGYPNTFDSRLGAGLAKRLGVRHLTLPMDPEPLDRILPFGFQRTEGMYQVIPSSPILGAHDLFPHGTHILSGYLGETIWGARDAFIPDGAGWEQRLWQNVLKRGLQFPLSTVTNLFPAEDWDELGFKDSVLSVPAATPTEKYTHWHYDSHQINRVPLVLQIDPDRLFYVAPHVHSGVIEAAYRLPRSLRERERGYFAAFQLGYPEIYRFPTTRNYGYPLGKPVKWRTRISRRMFNTLAEVDKLLWQATGRFFFYGPQLQYAHRMEIYRAKHRETVLHCLDSLRQANLVRSEPLRKIREDFAARRIVPPLLLKSLITLQQWEAHYGHTETRASAHTDSPPA